MLACMYSTQDRSHDGGGSTWPAATPVPAHLPGSQHGAAGASASALIWEPLPAAKHRASRPVGTGARDQLQPAGSSSSSGRSRSVAIPVGTSAHQPAAATAAPTLLQPGPAEAPPAELDKAYWDVFDLLQQAAEGGSASDAILSALGGAVPRHHAATGPQYKCALPGAQLQQRQPKSPLARQLRALRSNAGQGQTHRDEGGAPKPAGGFCGAGACLGSCAAEAGPEVPQLAATALPYAISLLVPHDSLPPAASTLDPHDATAQHAAAAALREHCREGRWVAVAAAAGMGSTANARSVIEQTSGLQLIDPLLQVRGSPSGTARGRGGGAGCWRCCWWPYAPHAGLRRRPRQAGQAAAAKGGMHRCPGLPGLHGTAPGGAAGA